MAVAVAVVAGTAGCSAGAVTQKAGEKAGESGQTILAALSRAADEASKAGSADISATVTSPDTGGKPVTMKGLYSWGDGVAMETVMPAKDLQMEEMVKDGTITMRLAKGAYYYEVDRIEEGPYKGKTWIRVEVSAVLGEKGAAAATTQGDPTAALKSLKYAKNASSIGAERINGRNTKHYRTSVPAAQMGAAADMYQHLGVSGEVVTDVWLDDNGMPARLNHSVGTMTMSMDFLSFRTAKTVEVPPPPRTSRT
ncbi:hypothetical protein ACFVX6_32875 [Streptomyces sp. NPDC058289]|uniref:hypothetical protein n=1 Tax=Streptomyces sp. NPDC058289 TaxID=3346425 RepID=UPI0036E00BE2